MADIIARPEDHLHKFKTYGDEVDGSSGVIPYVEADVTVSSGSVVVTNVVEVNATGQGDVPITLDSEVVEVDATGQGDVPVTLDGEAVELAASEAHIGQVGGEGITISQTPAVTAGAYTANEAVGGLLTFANAGRASALGGVIKDILILDDAGQDVELELWLFNATFTAMVDNAAWAPSEADLRKLVGIISTADGAWFAAGTPSVARVEASQRYDLVGTSLFGQLVTRGTPTFAAVDDVTVIMGLLRD